MSISNYNSWNRCAKSYRAVARRPYTSQRKSENDPLLFPAVLKIIGYSVSNSKFATCNVIVMQTLVSIMYIANSSVFIVHIMVFNIFHYYFYTHHDRVWIAMPKTKTWTQLNVFIICVLSSKYKLNINFDVNLMSTLHQCITFLFTLLCKIVI